MSAVSSYVDPAQRGFITGRNGCDHTVNINTLFYEAVKRKKERILFLLDTAKAFDSIDHQWINHILARVSFPSWVRNFVRAALTGVKVSPYFGGPPTDWIVIERGVKQGCPLSPLLFVIV